MTIAFDILFQHSPNAYMVVDRELRYLEVNPAYEQVTGHRRDQLVGRGLFEVFPGADNADGSTQARVLRASLERVFATVERDVLALIPYVIAPATGEGPAEVRYWSATHTPVKDADGRMVGVLQHTTDVTEIHRMRERVRRAQAATGLTLEQMEEGMRSRAAAVQRDNERLSADHRYLTGLFEQAPGFIAVLRGTRHVFTLANRAYEALIGRHDIVGRPVREVLPEVAGQGFFELLDQVYATGEPFVGRGMAVNLALPGEGERTRFVDFVYQPILDEAGRVDGIFVQGADVSDRELALAAARESEARLRTIADLAPQMIWSTRADGFHDYFNRRWYDYTGMPEGETDGDAWVAMFHPDDRERARGRWRHSLATGEPYEIEYRLRDRAGDYRWVLGRALPVRDADGRIVRWMGSCTEIHAQKLASEALQAADLQKDRFLAMLAHELRNPLAPIGTAAQLLRLAPDRPEAVRQAAEIIDRQAAHMRRLVEDLIDVSRVTRGLTTLQPGPVALAPVVAAALEQAAPLIERRRHHLQVDNRAPGLQLTADATRLTQVLANLFGNAAKYTPPQGRITVEIDREGDTALVRVADNGIGMDDTLLPRVFDLFAQASTSPERHDGGLGIGLALAHSLVQQHGGTLQASSPGLGAGSVFELRLPLAGPPAG